MGPRRKNVTPEKMGAREREGGEKKLGEKMAQKNGAGGGGKNWGPGEKKNWPLGEGEIGAGAPFFLTPGGGQCVFSPRNRSFFSPGGRQFFFLPGGPPVFFFLRGPPAASFFSRGPSVFFSPGSRKIFPQVLSLFSCDRCDYCSDWAQSVVPLCGMIHQIVGSCHEDKP